MYYFTFKGTNLHKIYYRYAPITKIHTLLDSFLCKKLHIGYYFSTFFTFLRVKIIDKATIKPNAHG